MLGAQFLDFLICEITIETFEGRITGTGISLVRKCTLGAAGTRVAIFRVVLEGETDVAGLEVNYFVEREARYNGG